MVRGNKDVVYRKLFSRGRYRCWSLTDKNGSPDATCVHEIRTEARLGEHLETGIKSRARRKSSLHPLLV